MEYRISIYCPPDRERLVAAIMIENVQWAEVSNEHGECEVEFYPRPDEAFWRLPYVVAARALDDAKRRLESYLTPRSGADADEM